MNDTVMTHPRVAAALPELREAVEESGAAAGDNFKSMAVVTLYNTSSETAFSGCKCEVCMALISKLLGSAVDRKHKGSRPDIVLPPASGMH